MADRLGVLLDPEALEPKISPLLSNEETLAWEKRMELARKGPHSRIATLRGMFDNLQIRRVQARPDPYLLGLVILLGSKVTYGPTQMTVAYTDAAEKLWATYNTPEARWWTDKVLEGLLHMPRSYAMSAATRYFKATGKQAKLDKPGVGLLSTVNGWKGQEVKTLMGILVTNHDYTTGSIGAPLMKTESTGRYGDAAKDYTGEEMDKLWETDAIHSATRIERDDVFIKVLRGRLAEWGMTQPPLKTNPKKVPKPRKMKVFKKGDVIRSRYVRDLLPGTKITKGEKDSYSLKEGTTYTWYGKNKNHAFVIEDTSKAPGQYGRYIPVTASSMDGCIIKSLPKPMDPEDLEPPDAQM